MQPHKKFAFDVGITFLASAVTLPLGFVITIALGRYLGAGDLGLYRMTSTIYGIALLITAVGIPAAMIKYVAEFKDDRTKFNQIASSGVITSLFLGIGFIALFYFSSGLFANTFNMPELSGLLKLLSPVFPFALVSGALLGLLNGLREMKKYAAATIIHSILMVIVTVVLIYYGFGVAGAVIGIVLSAVGNCLYLIFVSRNYFEITFSEYVPTAKNMLQFGWKLVAGNAINQVNYHADILLIGYFLTATDVGYYAVAVGLSKFFWIIPQSIQTITYPATSEYWAENNHSALQTMIDKSMKYSACILLPIGLGVGFFANDIITTIFGEEFIYSVLPLLILLVGTIIGGATGRAIGSTLAGIGRADLNPKMSAASATTNIILNIILIPSFGIVGAAIATAISLSMHAFLNLFLIAKNTGIKFDLQWYAKLAIMVIIGVWICYSLGFNYYANSIIILLTIFTLWFYFLKKDDRAYFLELMKDSKSYLSKIL
jgi:O-antigen/teichoic acid export membrane protein